MKPIYSSQSLPHVIFVVIYPRFSHFFFLRSTSTLNVEHCQLLCISLHKFWGGTSLLYMARITYNIEWAFNNTSYVWHTLYAGLLKKIPSSDPVELRQLQIILTEREAVLNPTDSIIKISSWNIKSFFFLNFIWNFIFFLAQFSMVHTENSEEKTMNS